jgi:hypothetical protein
VRWSVRTECRVFPPHTSSLELTPFIHDDDEFYNPLLAGTHTVPKLQWDLEKAGSRPTKRSSYK